MVRELHSYQTSCIVYKFKLAMLCKFWSPIRSSFMIHVNATTPGPWRVAWFCFFFGGLFLVFRGGMSLLWRQYEWSITKKGMHCWKFAVMTIFFPTYPDLVCFGYLSINNFIKLSNGKWFAGSIHGLYNHWSHGSCNFPPSCLCFRNVFYVAFPNNCQFVVQGCG